MTGHLDLEVDTESIRRAAFALDEAARQCAAAARTAGPRIVTDSGLGQAQHAGAAAALVNLRCVQAQDAVAQLSAISTGLADRLRFAAAAFDQIDAALAVLGR